MTLTRPDGQRTTVQMGYTGMTCLSYAIAGPAPADMYGAWTWEVSAVCAPFGGGYIPPQPFTVRPRPSPTPTGGGTPAPTATATARSLVLPRVLREAAPGP